MSATSIIMAGALQRDLVARGVRHLDLGECEAMVARMFDCVRTIERGTRDSERTEQLSACHRPEGER